MNYKQETVLKAVKEATSKYERPAVPEEIFFRCKGYVLNIKELEHTLEFLHKMGLIVRVGKRSYKAVKDMILIRRSKTLNQKIKEVIKDFYITKNSFPTSTEIVVRFSVMFGDSGHKDLGRHIRKLASARPGIGENTKMILKIERDKKYSYEDLEKELIELGKFVKKSL